MKKSVYYILIILSTIIIQSCATLVSSEITVFHDIDNYQKDKVFCIFPVQEQKGSLEFNYYANIIKSGLTERGMTFTDNIDNANIILLFSYGITDGKEKTGSLPVFGQTGISSSSSTFNFYNRGGNTTGNISTINNPSYGIIGTRQYSYTEYGRYLWIGMFDKQSLVDNNVKQLYNATIISVGSASNIKEVLPTMIKSFFTVYPGINGKVENITLEKE